MYSDYRVEERIETPYQRAKQEWDDRIGGARVQAKNWRIAALLLGVLNIFTLLGLILLASQSRIVPYIIEVDEIGAIKALGAVTEQDFTPSKKVVTYFLSQFVQQVRSIPSDPVVLKQQWLELYHFLTQRAANKMNRYARDSKPFERMQHTTITTEIISVTAISDTSYQVQWKETTFSKENSQIGEDRYTAILHLLIRPPEDQDAILKNPLGIFINDFHWSKHVHE